MGAQYFFPGVYYTLLTQGPMKAFTGELIGAIVIGAICVAITYMFGGPSTTAGTAFLSVYAVLTVGFFTVFYGFGLAGKAVRKVRRKVRGR